MTNQGRQTKDRSWLYEQTIYIVLWTLIILQPILNEVIAESKGLEFSWNAVFRTWIRTTPYVAIFLIHNFILIPNLLVRSRLKYYILTVVLLLFAIGAYNYEIYESRTPRFAEPPVTEMAPEEGFMRPSRPARPVIPGLLHTVMGMLLIGMNLATALMFRYYREQDQRKMLETIMLQDELKYLKAQINPHFFMNMLNNIHALIDIDREKAQDMILELSKLMRYVLYDGENQMTALTNEVRFISSYVSLMRLRYPDDKVEIILDIPEHPSEHAKLPPLMFIAFIENAFKHGVSYMKKSVIEITLKEHPDRIYFLCRNTKPAVDTMHRLEGGVGLENVKRRLSLLYGRDDMLTIADGHEDYTVKLNIPLR